MLDLDSKQARSIVDHKKAKIFMVKYDYKHKVVKARIEKFTGYATLMIVRVKNNQVVDIDYEIKEGNCALAYIQKKQLHVITKEDYAEQLKLKVKKGFVRFRVIGEETSLELAIRLKDKLDLE